MTTNLVCLTRDRRHVISAVAIEQQGEQTLSPDLDNLRPVPADCATACTLHACADHLHDGSAVGEFCETRKEPLNHHGEDDLRNVKLQHDSCGGHSTDAKIVGADSADALPELAAQLPRQTRIRAWEGNLDAATRPQPADLPPVPDRIHRRWDRFVRLVSDVGVRKLLNSQVTIFGLGGVGSYVAEALARSAVGRMVLVDFDDVCVTNVNRQLQAFPGTVGQSKAELLAARVRAIHPEAWVDPIQAFYDESTSDALLTPRPDFVVDAIDNVTSKVQLLETCLRRGIPVISITGAGARMDPTQIRVDDLSRTRVDPLARVLRKELSRRGVWVPGNSGLPVVFSEEDVREPEMPEWDRQNGFQCICPHRADSPHACEKRRVIYGTATFMTAAFAMAASSWVVRQLTQSTTIQPSA